MRVVFAAAEVFRPELKGKMIHMTNGTVRFADGQKMSSRLGNVMLAVDVIDAVREKIERLVDNPALVDSVTIGAIKYAFARYSLGGDIAFSHRGDGEVYWQLGSVFAVFTCSRPSYY